MFTFLYDTGLFKTETPFNINGVYVLSWTFFWPFFLLLSNILEIDHFKDKDFSDTTQRKKCSSFNTFDLDNVQLYVNLKKINNFKKFFDTKAQYRPYETMHCETLFKPIIFFIAKIDCKKTSKECMNVVKTNIFFRKI